MNPSSKSRFFIRLVAGLIWAPIAAECFLRLFAPVPMLPRYVEAGPHGVRANMPDREYRHQTPDYTITIRINGQGMRADQDYLLRKPEGTRRIVVLGDSFGMGYGVNLEDSSPVHLQTLLQEAWSCPVEVLNFSVSGFGVGEELVQLEREALAFQPDFIVQYYTATDPADDVRSNLYTLKEGVVVREAQTYLPAVGLREALYAIPAYRWMAGESHLYNLVRDHAGDQAKRVIAAFHSRSSSSAMPEMNSPDSSRLPYGERLSLALLVRMNEVASRNDANLVVLSIPRRIQRDQFKDLFPTSDTVLNVISPIAQFNACGGAMLYWEQSHGHFTPLGCKVIAEVLAEELIALEAQ